MDIWCRDTARSYFYSHCQWRSIAVSSGLLRSVAVYCGEWRSIAVSGILARSVPVDQYAVPMGHFCGVEESVADPEQQLTETEYKQV